MICKQLSFYAKYNFSLWEPSPDIKLIEEMVNLFCKKYTEINQYDKKGNVILKNYFNEPEVIDVLLRMKKIVPSFDEKSYLQQIKNYTTIEDTDWIITLSNLDIVIERTKWIYLPGRSIFD